MRVEERKVRGAMDAPIPVVQDVGSKSLTKQSMVAESDINNITERYLRTGQLSSPFATRRPIWGDFTAIDFQSMQNAIIDTTQSFNSLPARIRRRFNNSAYELLRFIDNPENKNEAIKMGILPAEEPAKDPNQQELIKDVSPSPAAGAAPKADPEAQPQFNAGRK